MFCDVLTMRTMLPFAEEPPPPTLRAKVVKLFWTLTCWTIAFGSVIVIAELLR